MIQGTNTLYLPYAGIGSRETPEHILTLMNQYGAWLGSLGFTLRSGHADGADMAFETGCDTVSGSKEIYLPWQGFNGSNSPYHGWVNQPTQEFAMQLAASFHPAWDRCSPGAKKMHARNGAQVLGWYMNQPALFGIGWTRDGKGEGGTGQAIRLLRAYGVPYFDLFYPENVTKLNELVRLFCNERGVVVN